MNALFKHMRQIVSGLCLFVVSQLVCLGQQSLPDVAGIWEFSFPTPAGIVAPATVEIQQTADKISGQFVSSRDLKPLPIKGYFSTGTLFIFVDETGPARLFISVKVPGDGKSMQGSYSLASGSVRGSTVRAKRFAGFAPPNIKTVTNAASGAIGPVAPGELISIYTDLLATHPIGPAEGATLEINESGKLANLVKEVRVLVLPLRVYAPLTYVSAGQVNALVPYEVAGLSTIQLQVEYRNQVSNEMVLQVERAAPGVFTADGTGEGRGLILNHDGRLNSPSEPELRGGIVVLYITGEGQTNPAGVSGAVTSISATPPKPVLPVSALVNGQTAFVVFCGEAPGLISGVLQVNVQIPTTVSPGNVPLQVSVGKINSKPVIVAIQ